MKIFTRARGRPQDEKNAGKNRLIFQPATVRRTDPSEPTLLEALYYAWVTFVKDFRKFLHGKVLPRLHGLLGRFLAFFDRPTPAIHDKNPSYRSALTRQQRGEVDRAICVRYRDILGYKVYQVPYTAARGVKKGSMLLFDLRADYNGNSRDYHVVIGNPGAVPNFGNGHITKNDLSGYDLNEAHTAAVSAWMFAARADGLFTVTPIPRR